LKTVKIPYNVRVREYRPGFVNDIALAVAAGDVGEEKVFDSGGLGEFGGAAGRHVGEGGGEFGFIVYVGGFDGEGIGVAADFVEVLRAPHIADVDEPRAGPGRAEYLVGFDDPPVGQRRRLPKHQTAPPGAGGDVEGLGFIGEERPPGLFFKEKAIAIGGAVVHGERSDGEVVVFKNYTGFELAQVKGDGRLCAAQHDAVQQVVDASHRPASGEDFHFFHRFPAHEGGEQPAEAQNVVEVAVGDEDFVKPLESQAGFQNLPLGALAAVHEEAVFVVNDDLRREAPVNGGGGGGGAEKDDFKQGDAFEGEITLPNLAGYRSGGIVLSLGSFHRERW